MSERNAMRKAWAGLLGAFGLGAARRGTFQPMRAPRGLERKGFGEITDARRGWGTLRQKSSVPGATAPMATGGRTFGSTRVDADSPALQALRSDVASRERRARRAWKGGALFRSMWGGDLAKRAGDGVLSEAERQQRSDAGKASAEARRARGVPGGPKFSPTRNSLYSQYVPSKGDRAEWAGMPDAPMPETPASGPFVRLSQKPQVPKELGEAKYVEIGRWAAQATREARPDIYERAAGKGLLPGEGKRAGEAKLDPKAVRLAYNHARNLAMHDVGLFRYDYAHTDEAIEQLKPLIPFMRYARDSQKNVLLSGRPGEWAAFRREFGTPHKDGRVHAFDTRGQKAGEPKRHFERRLNFLVDKDGKSPRLADLRKVPAQPMAKGLVERLAKADRFGREIVDGVAVGNAASDAAYRASRARRLAELAERRAKRPAQPSAPAAAPRSSYEVNFTPAQLEGIRKEAARRKAEDDQRIADGRAKAEQVKQAAASRDAQERGPRPLTDAEIEQRRAAARSPRRGSSQGRMPPGLADRLAQPEMPRRKGAPAMATPQAPVRRFGGAGRVAAAVAGGALLGGLGMAGWQAWRRRDVSTAKEA